MKIEELSGHAITVLTNNGFSRKQEINLDEEGFERYIPNQLQNACFRQLNFVVHKTFKSE